MIISRALHALAAVFDASTSLFSVIGKGLERTYKALTVKWA